MGDPIELGAAAAVFLDPKAPSQTHNSTNISLIAAKSWMGHSEPAAGLMGLAQAHMALHHHMQLPILHLGHINPHVASALQPASRAGQFQMPRQQACMLAASSRHSSGSGSLRCGVSAFAFQGTNAHAIIEQAPSQGNTYHLNQDEDAGKNTLLWRKQRHWIAPPALALLTGIVWAPLLAVQHCLCLESVNMITCHEQSHICLAKPWPSNEQTCNMDTILQGITNQNPVSIHLPG